MDSQIIVAIIGMLGVIFGSIITTIVGPIIVKRIQNRHAIRYRERKNIPDIIGVWETDWYINQELLHGGRMTLSNWIDENSINGYGEGRSKEGYAIHGEIDASRIFLATYKSKNYPTAGYIGAAIMEIALDGQSMSGTWTGRKSNDEYVKNGTVKCSFINKLTD